MTDDKDYWRRERGGRADAWSGGGAAFRAWMQSGAQRRRRRWVTIGTGALVSLALVAGIFAAPLALTGTDDSCTAFETALIQRTTPDVAGAKHQRRWPMPLGSLDLRTRSGGAMGRRITAMEHGWLPEFAGCAALYWQVRVSPLLAAR